MSFEQKRTWIAAIVAIAAYATYVVIVLNRAKDKPLADVAYVAPLLWTVGIAIAATIVLHIAISIASPEDAGKEDQRDREIYRFGEYIGRSFVDLGAVAALGMALAGFAHFWIANVIYLAFVLSAILSAIAKLVAYQRGFQSW